MEKLEKILFLKNITESTFNKEELEFLKVYKTKMKDVKSKMQSKKLEEKLVKARQMKAFLTDIVDKKGDRGVGNRKISQMCERSKKQIPRKFPLGWRTIPKRAM